MKNLLAAVLVGCFCASSVAQDWPQWRGPAGIGIAQNQKVPLTWSKTENVKWRVPLDGPGNSTPIVVGNLVLITHAPKDSPIRSLRASDRKTGDLVWKQEVEYAEEEPTHNTNPYCSASPTSDGERVVAWYGSAGLYGYDLQGKQLWHVDTGKVEHIWGFASSPLIYKNLVIQIVGPGLNAYVAAYDKTSGKEVWRKEYPGMVSKKFDEFRGSWSTPVVHREKNGDVLLLSLPQRLYAVNPLTGEEVWSCGGLKDLVYTSPIVAENIAVAMGGYGTPALAVETGGKGDVTETKRLWQHPKNPQRVGSGVIVDGYIYILNEPGIAWCLDLKTGEKQWEQRVERGNSWSSAVLVNGRIYIPSTSGTTFVLEPSPEELKIVAKNELGEMTRGSLALSGGEVFLRTYQALYCISNQD
jgi:outer membrane protein assembly factor BamB